MTIRRALLAAPLALGGALLLGACSDDDRAEAPPDPTATDSVIDLAAQTDEVAEPFPINDGAFVFDDTDEGNEPAPLDR